MSRPKSASGTRHGSVKRSNLIAIRVQDLLWSTTLQGLPCRAHNVWAAAMYPSPCVGLCRIHACTSDLHFCDVIDVQSVWWCMSLFRIDYRLFSIYVLWWLHIIARNVSYFCSLHSTKSADVNLEETHPLDPSAEGNHFFRPRLLDLFRTCAKVCTFRKFLSAKCRRGWLEDAMFGWRVCKLCKSILSHISLFIDLQDPQGLSLQVDSRKGFLATLYHRLSWKSIIAMQTPQSSRLEHLPKAINKTMRPSPAFKKYGMAIALGFWHWSIFS